MKYTAISIKFRDGSAVEFSDDWDDFILYDGFIIVKNQGVWIAGYNLKDVAAFNLIKTKDKMVKAS